MSTNRRRRQQKAYSSLSALPSLPSSQSTKPIQKTRQFKTKKCYDHNNEQKEQEPSVRSSELTEYDSSDSLDQLLDVRNRSTLKHTESENEHTPRKNKARGAGGKRAKALAMMAATAKQPNRARNGFKTMSEMNESSKKEYKAICDQFVTPAISQRTYSNFNTLRNSRKVITPFHDDINHEVVLHDDDHRNSFDVTPKKATNSLKCLETPFTPTPTKLFKTLNVRTPNTVKLTPRRLNIKEMILNKEQNKNIKETKNNHNINRKKVRERDNNNESWKDMEYIKHTKNNKKNGECSEYERLLRVSRGLRLPNKWNILMQKFKALESAMGLYMRKSIFFVHYVNVRNAVQQICRKSMDDNDLQQIMSVVPDFYHVQWTANTNKLTKKKDLKLTLTAMDYDPFSDAQIGQIGTNKHDEDPFNVDKNDKNEKLKDVGIKFLKVSKLKERENVFRLRLVQYVACRHKEWLNENVLAEFDPFESGEWHKRFDLENIRDIEQSPFPSKPKKNMHEIERMISEQEKKLKDVVQKELEEAKENLNEKSIPKHLQHLSPTFIAKIRAKKKNKIVTTKRLKTKKEHDAEDEQYRLQQLPYLVGLMRGIYVSMKKSSMSCDDLVKVIKKRHRNVHVLNAEIWKQLQILAGLNSNFFKIKQGSRLKIAKLNKKIPTKQVLDEIKTKLK